MQTKFIVILGSLMSGLGKGAVTSSILKILDFYDCKVLPMKFDGYLNYDCGTMNPYRHGEVFVLDDKSEVDMDFGMYERFLNKDLTTESSITGGKIFSRIIAKERKGDFLGEDVQIIPHLTNEIISGIENIVSKRKPDVFLIEVGGTVGDIENSYFVEAMRQLALRHKTIFFDLTYIPTLEVVGEQKTKPAQLGFRSLLEAGIRPDYVVCRSSDAVQIKVENKLALFGNLPRERIIDDSNQGTIYNLPLHFMDQGLDKLLMKDLSLEKRRINHDKVKTWREKVARILRPKGSIDVAIVGKYTNLKDSYASLNEALIHAGAEKDSRINIKWIEATDIENDPSKINELKNMQGIIVPIGFGERGAEGMIKAIQYARENKIPYLGLCYGMQLMAIEYARHVAGFKDASSEEFSKKSKNHIIHLMPSQVNVKEKGGTMRLGSWPCKLTERDSIAYAAYKTNLVHERHRHRYEFNNKYRGTLKKKGLKITGVTPDNKLVEFIEWTGQYGIGTQAHPEYKSRLENPAPIFVSFIEAAMQHEKAMKLKLASTIS